MHNKFPISRDPPEGGTICIASAWALRFARFQFLGIPPKGELLRSQPRFAPAVLFPISRDPPEGGTVGQGGARTGAGI